MQILSPKSCRATGCQQPRNLHNLQICQKTCMAVPESQVKWAYHITSHLLLKLNNKKVHMKHKTRYHWTRVWKHSISTVCSIGPTVLRKALGHTPQCFSLLLKGSKFTERSIVREAKIYLRYFCECIIYDGVCVCTSRTIKNAWNGTQKSTQYFEDHFWFLFESFTAGRKCLWMHFKGWNGQPAHTAMEKAYPWDQWRCITRLIRTRLTPHSAIPLKSNAHRNCTTAKSGKDLCPKYHPISSGSTSDGQIRFWSEVFVA